MIDGALVKRNRPGKSGRHKLPILGLRPRAEVVELLRELARRNRRTITEELTIAIEKHIQANGPLTLPPPTTPEPAGQ